MGAFLRRPAPRAQEVQLRECFLWKYCDKGRWYTQIYCSNVSLPGYECAPWNRGSFHVQLYGLLYPKRGIEQWPDDPWKTYRVSKRLPLGDLSLRVQAVERQPNSYWKIVLSAAELDAVIAPYVDGSVETESLPHISCRLVDEVANVAWQSEKFGSAVVGW